MSFSGVVISETLALTPWHGRTASAKTAGVSHMYGQPASFASPQSSVLTHSLLQGSGVGQGRESTINECNERSLDLGC